MLNNVGIKKMQNTNWPVYLLHLVIYRINVITSACAGQVICKTHN